RLADDLDQLGPHPARSGPLPTFALLLRSYYIDEMMGAALSVSPSACSACRSAKAVRSVTSSSDEASEKSRWASDNSLSRLRINEARRSRSFGGNCRTVPS